MTKFEKKQLLIQAKEGKKIGIDELKKVQTWKAELIEEIHTLLKKKKEGKKISKIAIFRFVNDLMGLLDIISNHKEIYAELIDLDSQEAIELEVQFKKELDLGDDSKKTERIVETVDIMLTTVIDGIIDITNEY